MTQIDTIPRPDWITELERDGACVTPEPVSAAWLDAADAAFAHAQERGVRAGDRNGLDAREIVELVRGSELRRWVERVLGDGAVAVRAILFAKSPSANWGVPWHQDRVVAVAARQELDGFTEWSRKGKVLHAHAPASVLAKMIALRIDLDAADEENGALKTLPGSHRLGVMAPSQVEAAVSAGRPRLWTVSRGEVLMMRPLALHASGRGTDPERLRRVLHVEFAVNPLPAPLKWNWSV